MHILSAGPFWRKGMAIQMTYTMPMGLSKVLLIPADAHADDAAFTALEQQMNRELALSCAATPESAADHCIWLPDGLAVLLITTRTEGDPPEYSSHLRLFQLSDGHLQAERYLQGYLKRLGGSKYMHPSLVWSLSDKRLGLLDASSLCFR